MFYYVMEMSIIVIKRNLGFPYLYSGTAICDPLFLLFIRIAKKKKQNKK